MKKNIKRTRKNIKRTRKNIKRTRKNIKRTRKIRKYNKKYFFGGEETNKRKRGEFLEEQLSLDELYKREREKNILKRLKQAAEDEKKQAEIIRLKELHSMLPPLSRREIPIIPVKNVVEQSASRGYTGHAQVSRDEIDKFVTKNITTGPQIVNFAVGNYNHAILIDVQGDKVMISDWKGDPRLFFLGNDNYRNYFELLTALEKSHTVEFYPVDLYLKEKADEQNRIKGNAGGCSEYLYNWINVYYRPGHYAPPF